MLTVHLNIYMVYSLDSLITNTTYKNTYGVLILQCAAIINHKFVSMIDKNSVTESVKYECT